MRRSLRSGATGRGPHFRGRPKPRWAAGWLGGAPTVHRPRPRTSARGLTSVAAPSQLCPAPPQTRIPTLTSRPKGGGSKLAPTSTPRSKAPITLTLTLTLTLTVTLTLTLTISSLVRVRVASPP